MASFCTGAERNRIFERGLAGSTTLPLLGYKRELLCEFSNNPRDQSHRLVTEKSKEWSTIAIAVVVIVTFQTQEAILLGFTLLVNNTLSAGSIIHVM